MGREGLTYRQTERDRHTGSETEAERQAGNYV